MKLDKRLMICWRRPSSLVKWTDAILISLVDYTTMELVYTSQSPAEVHVSHDQALSSPVTPENKYLGDSTTSQEVKSVQELLLQADTGQLNSVWVGYLHAIARCGHALGVASRSCTRVHAIGGAGLRRGSSHHGRASSQHQLGLIQD